MERRTFLASGAAAIASQPAYPASDLKIGLIGSGGRGRYILGLVRKDAAVRITGVCDVYEPNLERGLSEAGGQAKAYRDYRALLDDREIGVVMIATPEHWHHRMLLDALAAGKDVYIEKPLCQTPEQGVQMVEAAKRSRSIVQVGTQRRSYDLYLKARDLVRSGKIGQVRMVRSWWLNTGLTAPSGKLRGPLDWEQWQGPARRLPLDAARFFHWRSYADYSGGVMADQGAHVFDGIHMLMGAGYPAAVTATAGKIHRPGVDTPEVVSVTAEYPEDFVATFCINYAAMRYKRVNDQMNHLDGSEARLDIGREGFAVYRREAEETAAMQETSGGMDYASEAHVRNFLDCVRTRTAPNASVETAFQAALVTQMANLSIREGRRIRWDSQRMATI